MKRGKQTCKILKEIRKQIAEANEIEFITSECQYQGDCLGTCPKCEAEVRYLEQQLEHKRIAGRTISVLGISAGLIAMTPIIAHSANLASTETNQKIVYDTITNSKKNIDTKMVSTPGIIIAYHSNIKKLSENDTLSLADVMPKFPGGASALMDFISKNIDYSNVNMNSIKTRNRVIVTFIVDKKGNVIKPVIIHALNPDCDKEALRVISLMPKWKPAILNNKKYACKYTVPITFKLEATKKIKAKENTILENDTLDVADTMPEFPGGASALMDFISQNIIHPNANLEGNGTQGRAIVGFVVDKDGSILNPKIIRSVDPYLDREALRVVNLMPKWKPGIHKGKRVAVRYKIPIKFSLQ